MSGNSLDQTCRSGRQILTRPPGSLRPPSGQKSGRTKHEATKEERPNPSLMTQKTRGRRLRPCRSQTTGAHASSTGPWSTSKTTRRTPAAAGRWYSPAFTVPVQHRLYPSCTRYDVENKSHAHPRCYTSVRVSRDDARFTVAPARIPLTPSVGGSIDFHRSAPGAWGARDP